MRACVCLAQAMTEDELENVAMERTSFLTCVVTVWMCIADAVQGSKDKKKQEAEAATAAEKEAAAKELQKYLDQCK